MCRKLTSLSVSCITILSLLAPIAQAHPGNTAADGCHYCRTNCDKWGVPWNERHCHNEKPVVQTPVKKPVITTKVKKPAPKKAVVKKAVVKKSLKKP